MRRKAFFQSRSNAAARKKNDAGRKKALNTPLAPIDYTV
jgi:hypothetical protein